MVTPTNQCCQSVEAKRVRVREAGARKRVFQKMAGSEAWSKAFIYIYIFKRKHVECQTRCKIYETCMFVILPNLDWDTISLEMANGPSIVTIYVGVAFVDQWFNFFDSRQFFNISDIQFFIFDCICEGSTIYNLYLDFLTYSWFARCSGCLFVDKWKRASCMCNLHKHKKIQHKHGLTTTKTPK